MSLATGTKLGPYEIVAPIGAGGMGEVYRAHDTRLGRDVALKILPEAFARDPERLARFEREARLLAALNHPNVGAIYGIEEAQLTGSRPATRALTLELVEGETLAEVMERRRTPGEAVSIEEALAIARQIAGAIDAAHEKGIIHRDLKPANVMITSGGTVKVLDFGLARVIQPNKDGATSETTEVTVDSTLPGMLLGTAAYMCPDRARGKVVDKRTDIWAFGCVLYEMLTGERAFAGNTIPDIIAHVIGQQPDWSRLPPHTPPSIQRLLRRCLQKDPRRRLRDIGDACLELDEAGAPAEHEEEIGRGLGAAPSVRPKQDVRLERLTDSVGMAGSPAISPDGKMVAFVAVVDGRRQICIRLLKGGAPLQITHDNADHEEPRWLPDSSALIYHATAPGSVAGNLWQISALGGPSRRLAAATGGGDVSHDGRHLALFQGTGDEVALVVIELGGSVTDTVTRLSPDCHYSRPRWSPDDRFISFERAAVFVDEGIDVVPVSGSEARALVRASWIGGHSWLADGSGVVYSTSTGSTMAYPPTNNLRIVDGDGANDRQLTFGDVSFLGPDVHPSGRLLASRVRSRSDIWKFSIEGAPADNVRDAVRITRQTGQIQAPSVSPDGRDLVYISDSGGHSNLWMIGTDGASRRQVTFERDPGVTVAAPMWSPAGDSILFVRGESARIDLCLINADGEGFKTLLRNAYSPCWSHDGRSVYCSQSHGQIVSLNVETGAVVPVRADRAISPIAAPDGRALYFVRMPELSGRLGGEHEICRATSIDGPAEVLVRVPGSRVPMAPRFPPHANVSPDGRWLGVPLIDNATTNLWLVPTDGSPMRAATDFGDRSVFIGRSISWSADSRHIYAAVADTDADIIMLDGVLA